jgi:hypothetical protein
VGRAEQRKIEDAAYRAIGRYVVTFSQLVFFMRHLMSLRLKRPEDHMHPMRLAFGAGDAYSIANSYFAICIDIGDLDGTEQKRRRLGLGLGL